jgi:hypothetical protein
MSCGSHLEQVKPGGSHARQCRRVVLDSAGPTQKSAALKLNPGHEADREGALGVRQWEVRRTTPNHGLN